MDPLSKRLQESLGTGKLLSLAPSVALIFDSGAANPPFLLSYRASGGSLVLHQACTPERSSSGSRGSPIWPVQSTPLCRLPRPPSTHKSSIFRRLSRAKRLSGPSSSLQAAEEQLWILARLGGSQRSEGQRRDIRCLLSRSRNHEEENNVEDDTAAAIRVLAR
jgi:hypothetical protein